MLYQLSYFGERDNVYVCEAYAYIRRVSAKKTFRPSRGYVYFGQRARDESTLSSTASTDEESLLTSANEHSTISIVPQSFLY